MYNIKQLKELIKDLPDDMEVGSTGHFGEKLECYSVELSSANEYSRINPPILIINLESAGDEPD